MKLSLAFSPCPNDTFIFDALVNGKIDSQGIEFDVVLEDVETLNTMALQEKTDVSKVSFHAYLHLLNKYILLESGAALGEGCGPLLVSREPHKISELEYLSVAIPGRNTTANLLLGILFPQIRKKQEMVFSDIEDAVLSGRTDLGLIIHESRFTYQAKGLFKLADLGDVWEMRTGTPVPLGGIVAKRSLPGEVIILLNKLVRESVAFAFANPDSGWDYIKNHAQATDDEVIRQHIALYVTKYSLELGEMGHASIQRLIDEGTP